MSNTDPHIHVERNVVQAGADFRNAISSTLGLVTDAPTVVTTGCGREVPYAMTSARPESVTCLPCRDHAHQEYLKFADQVERLSQPPQVVISAEQAAQAVSRLRDIAARYAE
jgi:predicted RNase H-like nuclease